MDKVDIGTIAVSSRVAALNQRVMALYLGTVAGNLIGNIYDSTVRDEEFDFWENFNPFGNDGVIRK